MPRKSHLNMGRQVTAIIFGPLPIRSRFAGRKNASGTEAGSRRRGNRNDVFQGNSNPRCVGIPKINDHMDVIQSFTFANPDKTADVFKSTRADSVVGPESITSEVLSQ